MTISMYNSSVPVFKQLLSALGAILTKAEQAEVKSETLLQAQLFPDMFDFTRQVQIATDFAKGVSARLAGIEVPAYEDKETTFSELQTRITKTLEFISSISPDEINGSEDREIITRPGTPKEKKFKGEDYLLHYGLPQFFFHITTAYGILRSQGVEIGKRDYMGAF
ncbi:hypothetical protein BN59_01614 [Legionella massiliensis]|uniref:DUF1993 domain-containing protein n=1 Tax=Legionella massiliensis TaxID=1034943 RepID=A0A078KWF8_9GAMM|nr:DUF1993 domain-containing protein [Legionella massiliensis]CDZ77331.1 hypothetical protein BN59_01614 [Legionella massiliensis]CEE13069.1 hypothetical protein BN1094_01614 [Legionella massiliensis]